MDDRLHPRSAQGKRISARELTAEFYQRIEQRNPQINAYLALCPERAYKQADYLDGLVARGESLPGLAGLPLAVKDVLSTKGVVTTCASRILEGYRPPFDATAVERLERVGAVVLGKTNCDEFAMGGSNENSAFGPVRNPRGYRPCPGRIERGIRGSGSRRNGGGSIGHRHRRLGPPARFVLRDSGDDADLWTSLALWPDRVRVFSRPCWTFCSICARSGQNHGGYGRRDPMDSTAAAIPVPDYPQSLDEPVKGLRIGVPTDYFAEGLDSEVREKVERGIRLLERLGCRRVDLRMPHTDYAVATYYLIATAEASSNLARYDGVRYGMRIPEER